MDKGAGPVAANVDQFVTYLAGLAADIRAAGHVSLRAIAAELEARGMRTRRGGTWQVSSVRGLLARLAEAESNAR